MNKKIKELAKQAAIESDFEVEVISDAFLEKFSELFVGECVKVIKSSDDKCDDEWDFAQRDLCGQLKEHFGVECSMR